MEEIKTKDQKFMITCYRILGLLEKNMRNSLRVCELMTEFVRENIQDEEISTEGKIPEYLISRRQISKEEIK